jgi:hypothetical protein
MQRTCNLCSCNEFGTEWSQLANRTVLAFLDDIFILSKSFEDHLDNLADTLSSSVRKYKRKLKPKKCIIFQQEVEFLGRIASSNTLSMSKESI